MQVNTKYTLHFYARHVWRYPWLALGCFLGLLVGATSDMTGIWMLKFFVDVLTQDRRVEVFSEALFILIGILALGLLSTVGWQLLRYCASTLQSRVMKNIAEECFERLHQHSFRFFNNQFVGALVKRVNRMVRAFVDITDLMLFSFGGTIFRTLVALATFFWVSPLIGGLVFLWATGFVAAQYVLSVYKLNRYDLPKAAADTHVTAQLADTITNHSTIQLFARLPFEMREFKRASQDWARKTGSAWWFQSHLEGAQGLLMVLLTFLILYVSLRLWSQGSITVGTVVLVQTYLWEMYMALWDFGRHIRHFYEHLADANEMSEILRTPYEVVDFEGARALKVGKGMVEFHGVTFSYAEKKIDEEGGEAGVERDVLKQLSFGVQPGERIALIGSSGGGKTTITKLLLRLFDVQRGHITIDGQDIARVKQASLRAQIALVPQDPILFHRSIRENIRYGRLDATDKEVVAAAKLAHCHEFISRFPDGYNTFVGERGVKLSGGERQRVAIARALLANTRILILDEATSSLDSESEKYIKDALKILMKGKTVFVIAHRLSTVVDMDRILVLEHGKIVQQGSHAELLQSGGLYKRLWDLQVGGYLS